MRVGNGTMPSTRNVMRSTGDRVAVALSTWGVGFIPLAPGTWGSAVAVGLYAVWDILLRSLLADSGQGGTSTVWRLVASVSAFVVVCASGIWAASRTAQVMDLKDPQIVVVDEVMGQLLTFLFIPFGSSWKVLLAGFLLFRLFDIWKPYPIKKLEALPGGFGVCADDLLAGVYAGVLLVALTAFIA